MLITYLLYLFIYLFIYLFFYFFIYPSATFLINLQILYVLLYFSLYGYCRQLLGSMDFLESMQLIHTGKERGKEGSKEDSQSVGRSVGHEYYYHRISNLIHLFFSDLLAI